VTTQTRLQASLVSGVFEAGTPIAGHRIASDPGQAVHWPDAILLVIAGGPGLVRSLRDSLRRAADGPAR
jgi:hypothetical protein